MFRLKNPSWINTEILNKKLDEFSEEVFAAINQRLKKITTESPVVSIIIAAYNEEANIIRCIDSLSQLKSNYPFEIIIVDNNSSDNTAEVIQKVKGQLHFSKNTGLRYCKTDGNGKRSRKIHSYRRC